VPSDGFSSLRSIAAGRTAVVGADFEQQQAPTWQLAPLPRSPPHEPQSRHSPPLVDSAPEWSRSPRSPQQQAFGDSLGVAFFSCKRLGVALGGEASGDATLDGSAPEDEQQLEPPPTIAARAAWRSTQQQAAARATIGWTVNAVQASSAGIRRAACMTFPRTSS